ncbi:MAG: endonuclease/exonuclease/phosphatase family protein [Alphaproteobacteria bacterium]
MPNNRPLSLLVIAGMAALAGAALSVVGAYTGSLSFFLDFFGQFAIQAIVVAIALALLFAVLRRPALAAVSIAVAAAGYFAINIASPVEPCAGAPTHRLLFFNVWDDNMHASETVDFVARQNAETVVLAEVNPRFRPALGKLRKLYPYRVECPEDEECQFYVYSRFPISKVEHPSRSFVEIIAAYPEATVTLAGLHALRPFPFHRFWYQMGQVSFMANSIAHLPEPRIIVGDFNAASWSAIIKTVSRIDNVKPLPSRGTWFAGVPWPLRIPIDNALVSDEIVCAKKTVGPSVFSDHRPIWIDFAFESGAAKGAH